MICCRWIYTVTIEKSFLLQNILDYKHFLKRPMTLFSYKYFFPYLADVMEGMCCSLVSNHYEYKYPVVSLQLIEPVHSEVLIVLSNELVL